MRKQKCLIAGLLAVSVASVGLLSGCDVIDNVKSGVSSAFNSIFSKQTLGNECFKEINGNKYYIDAGMILNITDMNEIKAVGVKADDQAYYIAGKCNYANDIEPIYLSSVRSVLVGDTIYTSYINQNDAFAEGIYKYTFTDDPCLLNEEVWIDNDTLNDSEISLNSGYFNNLIDLKTDGKYIYCINYPTAVDYILSYKNEKNDTYQKLCRIELKTNKIEVLEDVVATSYTIDNGWIYYYDNGYTNEFAPDDIDKDRRGIYKAKTDGTQVEKLYSIKDSDKDYGYCSQIEVHNGKIYFIDNTDTEKYKLSCISMDGSDYEEISEKTCFGYTYDEKDKTFYYVHNEEESRSIRKINSDFEEEKMDGSFSIGFNLYYNEGKLYFSDNGYFSYNVFSDDQNEKKLDYYDIGIIYDIEEQETTKIQANFNYKIIHDGIFENRVYDGPYFDVK